MLERVESANARLDTWRRQAPLPWIEVCADAPYFQTEDGDAWHPIGHNDAISWPDLAPLYMRRDVASVDAYLARLAAKGVTVLRVMLEYAQVKHRYFERPAGVVTPRMAQLWDDLFALCETHGLRLLIAPYDTFWTWIRWDWHPYNVANGGPLAHPSQFLLCRDTRELIKQRLEFVARRWGGSGAFFAWDLQNEIHPAQAGDSADCFPEFIADLSRHVRRIENDLYGRSHPQTVSIFGPELEWRAHMPLREPIFRHPDLDFASVHIYQHGTIDDPRNTIDPARDMARHVRDHVNEITDARPYFDSEHGPIHRFKDKHRTLPEPFDDEYFRHMQWAHLAAGGAGGGMRWPNRKPHRLTPGMHDAQHALSRFMPLIDWRHFRRKPVDVRVPGGAALHAFACADEAEAIVYLLRGDAKTKSGMLDASAAPIVAPLVIPGLAAGRFLITPFDTVNGVAGQPFDAVSDGRALRFLTPPIVGDLALAVRSCT
jgi:hypothetical protein